MHGLGSASPPVGMLSASGEMGTPEPPTSLLVKHLSIFGLLSITTFRSSSPSLAIPCFALAAFPLDASSHLVSSRVRDRPDGRGYIVPGALDSARVRHLGGRTPGKSLQTSSPYGYICDFVSHPIHQSQPWRWSLHGSWPLLGTDELTSGELDIP